MLTVSGLYWDTCLSFTMLALFHAKVIDYLHRNVSYKDT